MSTFNGAQFSEFTGVPGWETVLEQETLAAYAKRVPHGGNIVEIGAEFGMSASIFCQFADPSVDIYSIDLFPGDLMTVHRENLARAGFAQKTPAGYVGRSTPIQGDSFAIGIDWKNWQLNRGRNGHRIDLLFIDGDHSYEGVQRDIAAWETYVKVNGVIIFHDAAPPTNKNPHPLHHEVQRAIDLWKTNNWTEQPPVDTMRIFIRER